VPVLFLQTSAASTTVEEWRDVAGGATPGSLKEYDTLRSALRRYVPMLGGARAVLWHQGEEDAGDLHKTSTADYAQALSQVIEQSRIDSGLPFLPWVVARVSSVRDTEPKVIAQDLAVERGQEAVIASDPLVYAGPLTDDLQRFSGNNVHYTPAAQAEHGQRWFERLKATIFSDTPIVTIATTRRRATEGESFARITLYRTGFTDNALTVSYMVGGHATNGIDYAPLSGRVTFNPGESFASVRIHAADDAFAERTESVTLTLLDAPEYALKTYDPVVATPIGSSLAPELATASATVVIAPSA
jgi:hypothetical protein